MHSINKYFFLKKYIFSCFIFSYFSAFGNDAIAYSLTNGRFGDQLLCYLHAKWFSYYYDIPLLYTPFLYSSELVLSDKEILSNGQAFSKQIYVSSLLSFENSKSKESTIYHTSYFAESLFEQMNSSNCLSVNWKDENFRQIVLPLLAPKKALQLVYPYDDCISIAIHIREGGNIDTDHTRYYAPYKLPPIDFYIDALKNMIDLFPKRELYCFVFTDALKPDVIVKKLQTLFPQVTFDYRKKGNGPKNYVLEDFFSFFEFDALIRPDSNFSIIPSLLHDYAVAISPKNFSYKNDSPVIDELNISIEKDLYQKLLKEKRFLE
jgi:hypothetical protein